VAEGARLESVYTLTAYRGFESLSLRQIKSPSQDGFFIGGREGENPRQGSTSCERKAQRAANNLDVACDARRVRLEQRESRINPSLSAKSKTHR
jgi:hypothetical protein